MLVAASVPSGWRVGMPPSRSPWSAVRTGVHLRQPWQIALGSVRGRRGPLAPPQPAYAGGSRREAKMPLMLQDRRHCLCGPVRSLVESWRTSSSSARRSSRRLLPQQPWLLAPGGASHGTRAAPASSGQTRKTSTPQLLLARTSILQQASTLRRSTAVVRRRAAQRCWSRGTCPCLAGGPATFLIRLSRLRLSLGLERIHFSVPFLLLKISVQTMWSTNSGGGPPILE